MGNTATLRNGVNVEELELPRLPDQGESGSGQIPVPLEIQMDQPRPLPKHL